MAGDITGTDPVYGQRGGGPGNNAEVKCAPNYE